MIKIIEEAHAGIISDAPSVLELLLSVLQFILSLVSIVAIIAVVISGLMYIGAGGNQDNVTFAKSALTASVIGLVVAVCSLVIVQLVIGLVS